MKYNIIIYPSTILLFIVLISLQHCKMNIDLNSDDKNYPKGTIIVTVLDSLNSAMPDKSIRISGNRDYEEITKITDIKGNVTFNNVPISHGPQKNYTTGATMPAGDYSYNFSVDYYSDDCCYYLGKRNVQLISDPMNVIIKLPDDLLHTDSVPDPENPGNYCYCQDSTST